MFCSFKFYVIEIVAREGRNPRGLGVLLDVAELQDADGLAARRVEEVQARVRHHDITDHVPSRNSTELCESSCPPPLYTPARGTGAPRG